MTYKLGTEYYIRIILFEHSSTTYNYARPSSPRRKNNEKTGAAARRRRGRGGAGGMARVCCEARRN